jgi:hypothetical protein
MAGYGLDGVKEGDLLIVSRGFYAGKLEKVDRVTKLHAICGTTKYRIRDGGIPGADSWSRVSASIASPEEIEESRVCNLRSKIEAMISTKSGYEWTSSTLKQVIQKLKDDAIESPEESPNESAT